MADSRKRTQSKPYDGSSHAKKKFDFSNLVGFRFLIPSKAAGSMIGKGGDVIKRLRTEFSCRIMVPDSQGPERMVIMDGTPDAIVDVWRDVLTIIKEYINAKECDYKSVGTKPIENEEEIDLRLVVHESQSGALIGKGGERIRNLIETHKMTIIKLSQSLCPRSSDRVVRMVGMPNNLLECLCSIMKLLEAQPAKGVRNDYDPDNYDESAAYNYGGFISKDARFHQRRGDDAIYGGEAKYGGEMRYGASSRLGDGYNDFQPRSNPFDRMNSQKIDENLVRSVFFGTSNSRMPMGGLISSLMDGVVHLQAAPDGQKQSVRVSLPVHLVNAVIGSDGRRLADIKRDSGAHIQLDDERLSDREDVFVVRGAADQVYRAQCLMQLCARKYGDQGGYYGGY